MQKEIETILKMNGYSFYNGGRSAKNMYDTIFRNYSTKQDYLMREIDYRKLSDNQN